MMLYFDWDQIQKKKNCKTCLFYKVHQASLFNSPRRKQRQLPSVQDYHVSLWHRPWFHNYFLNLSVNHDHFLFSKNIVYTNKEKITIFLSTIFLRTWGKQR